MNNIVVEHNGAVISIAQHYRDGKVTTQEAHVIGGEHDWLTESFGGNLKSLIKALMTIEKKLGEKEVEHKKYYVYLDGTYMGSTVTLSEEEAIQEIAEEQDLSTESMEASLVKLH